MEGILFASGEYRPQLRHVLSFKIRIHAAEACFSDGGQGEERRLGVSLSASRRQRGLVECLSRLATLDLAPHLNSFPHLLASLCAEVVATPPARMGPPHPLRCCGGGPAVPPTKDAHHPLARRKLSCPGAPVPPGYEKHLLGRKESQKRAIPRAVPEKRGQQRTPNTLHDEIHAKYAGRQGVFKPIFRRIWPGRDEPGVSFEESSRRALHAAATADDPPDVAAGLRERNRIGLLDALPEGSRVAVLVLHGSFNPITRAHTMMLDQAKQMLLDPTVSNDNFSEVIALVLPHDDFDVRKLLPQGFRDYWFRLEDRLSMINDVTVGTPWVMTADDNGNAINLFELRQDYPNLQFLDYIVEGADAIFEWRRWEWVDLDINTCRVICVGRPGYTDAVHDAVDQFVAENPHLSYLATGRGGFLMGPELPNISSTDARELARRKDRQELIKLVHPLVATALLKLAEARECAYVPPRSVPPRVSLTSAPRVASQSE